MTAPRDVRLIDELAADLEPVRRSVRSGSACLGWLVAGWAVVAALTWLTGPFRPGAGEQLLMAPRFALESGMALAAGVFAVGGAFALGTPGHRHGLLVRIAMLLVGGWLALLVLGLWTPPLAPSMLGKRSLCDLQTLLFALGPLALGFWALRRRAVLDRRLAGLCLGVAAGSLPALIMQWACMYDPAHALMHHLGPAAVVALAGAVLAPRLLPRL